MTTIVTYQPRPVPAFRPRQHSVCIAYPSSHQIPNPSQPSLSFPSSMDLHPRSYRPNRPPQFSSSNHHHVPHTPPHSHSHHPYYSQQRANMPPAPVPPSYARHVSPPLPSSTYPLVYSPSEHSYQQNMPPLTADIQHEYPFDIGFPTGSSMSMSFADLDLSQTAFLNPGQLPWSETKSDLKLESPPVPQQVFYADPGSYAFYSDSNSGSAAVDAQLFAPQPPQSHPLRKCSPAYLNKSFTLAQQPKLRWRWRGNLICSTQPLPLHLIHYPHPQLPPLFNHPKSCHLHHP
ncbi:hypothetical protein B0F90DRAFT_881739 [Multifurca ochricompacta]|uniref:Uncharacterized protein n=1 Tax=Multifurca ochricompacta TaxID=376703 RepID=A0AAD4M170_9AGAM|nr:hypothetical protein B0F90DRAFT_881739 [Multifurca ochricompacta]